MPVISFQEFADSIRLYNYIYQYGSLIVIVLFSLYLFGTQIRNVDRKHIYGLCILVLAIYYFGTYPYEYEADRQRYVLELSSPTKSFDDDFVWMYYTRICGTFLMPYQWLILTSTIYVSCFYLYCRKIHGSLSTIMFLGFVGFLFFKAYAVNTIRAGLASAIIFYGLTWREKKSWVYWGLLYTAVGTHFSMILPVASLLIAQHYPRTRFFFIFWLLCIPLSYSTGSYFQFLFEPYLADYNEKTSSYLIDEDDRYNYGYRLDFIIYSILPTLFAYYYIFKRNIKDQFYINIFNAYLIANSFWILIIRSNFSDRMAYLSWIFIPVLILYPTLKYKIWRNQNKKVAYILIGQALFTYVLSIR